jgi:hypothetical protein
MGFPVYGRFRDASEYGEFRRDWKAARGRAIQALEIDEEGVAEHQPHDDGDGDHAFPVAHDGVPVSGR